jgi:TolB-like protein
MPQLRLLGRAAVLDDQGRTAALSSRRHPMALLALLSATPSHALTRSRLVGFLWPDAPEKTGRNRLTTCVHQVRRALGERVLLSAGGDLQLDPDALPSDVVRFRAALEEGDQAAAVALYHGPFLDGFWLDGAREFEERVEEERDRIERAYREALEGLARAAGAEGDHATAVRWWRERAKRTPLDSRVTLELVEATARAGSRGEALETARMHAARLAEDLGAEPDPAFLARVEELTRRPTTRATPRPAAVTGASHRSLAVLPFDVSGTSADAQLLADGLLEDLLTELARIPELVVISHRSVATYRGTPRHPVEVARELRVAHVVQGSVQVLHDRLRLRVRLVDAARDVYVWAERYDRELTPGDMFEIQGDLAGKIAHTLRLEIDGARGERRAPVTEDLEAYRLCAQGRAFMSDRSRASMWRAVESFEKAIERDPEYALAWAGLSDALVLLGDYHHEEPEVVRDRGERAARRALALDPELAEAHAALGNFLSWQRRITEAVVSHRRATELRPGYAHAHQWLCWVNLLGGDPDRAQIAGMRATRLDPLEPEAGINLAAAHLGVGDPDAGLAEARRVLTLYPDFQYGRFIEGLTLWHLGDWEGGREALEALSDAWGRGLPQLGRVVALAGSGAAREARSALAELSDRMSPFHRVLARAALGDAEGALEGLGDAARLEWPDTLLLRYHPPGLTAALEGEERYRRFVAGVDETWGVRRLGAGA